MTTKTETSFTHNRLIVVAAVTAAIVIVGIVLVASHGSDPNGARADSATAPTNTVSVSGTGTVEGKPDTLVANFRVHVNQSSVQLALNDTASDANKVIASLEKNGLASKDIRTTDVALNPSYDRFGNVDGYDSSETLNVRIHPLTHVGQVLTAAAGAAGNSVNLQGISFDINDNTTLLASARAEAFNNAKAAAQQYATLGGTSLSHVEHITAVVHNASPVYPGAYGLATDSAKAALPIQAGQKKVSVTVKVIWALG
jgi:uncharacterized protein YggE